VKFVVHNIVITSAILLLKIGFILSIYIYVFCLNSHFIYYTYYTFLYYRLQNFHNYTNFMYNKHVDFDRKLKQTLSSIKYDIHYNTYITILNQIPRSIKTTMPILPIVIIVW